MNWLKYLVGISAVLIAGCAAYFSISGLSILFSGASISVMIMASSLEFAKIVSATYLKQTWGEIRGFNKWYLTSAVVILMLITSAGIFGYLSNAFQQQNLKLSQVEREVSVYTNRISINNSQITQISEQIPTYSKLQSSIIEKGKVNSRLLSSLDNRDKEIGKLNQKINTLQEENIKNNTKINEIRTANMDLEKEVGGFRFVAEIFNVPLQSVVKFFIFLIVFVFDPLAIALIIAFNGLIGKRKEEIGIDVIIDDGGISGYTKNIESEVKTYEVYGETPQITEKVEEPTSPLGWEQWMHPAFDWDNYDLWINDENAINYWLNSRGGSIKELHKIKREKN
jgi:hypothetical protein